MNSFVLFQSSLIPLLLITSFLSINFQFSVCADDAYADCSKTITCGGVKSNISYPFWGANRPEYCGKSGFEVTCQNDVPIISMKKIDFRILDMSNSTTTPTPTVKVARQDFWGQNSLEIPCDWSHISTDLNFSLFDYASGLQNVSFYYGCNSTATSAFSVLFKCDSDGEFSYLTEKQIANLSDISVLDSCDVVLVPVSAAAADALDNNQTSTIRNAVDGGFELNVQNDDTGLCNNCVASGGVCGQDTANAKFICYCQNLNSTDTCPSNSSTPNSSGSSSGSTSISSLVWIIGIPAGVFGTIILIVCCISRKRILVFFKKDERDEFDIEAFIRNHGSLSPKQYHYSDLKKMTNSFKDQIGIGGYGTVYKGKLPNGLVVAVKVLSELKGNGEEFINEVASIGGTSHVNIVTLVGFCYEGEKRALIYEYMPNGSLDKFIHYNKQGSSYESCRLEWKTLSEIAIGIARGLEYLHRGCNIRILHFDIKPQNILLDKDFCPKISDFGLAKLCMTKESTISMLGTRGTAGYIAPEVFRRNFGGVSHKSDVYSYGMLVLEMVGARKNLDSKVSHTSEMFPHYIYKDLELQKNEIIFGEITEDESKIARKMILISLACIQTLPSDRPSMSKVVEMLEGPLHSLPIPPKPLLFSEEESAPMSQPSETS